MFMSYEWKGNIREMQNVIERAVIFAEDEVIKTADIGVLGAETVPVGDESENLQSAVKAYERQQIRRVLSKYDWDKVEAARSLGIALSSLYRKIDELGIRMDERGRSQAG